MGTRISELPEVTLPLDADLVPSVQGGVTVRTTWTNIKAFLKAYFDGLYLYRNFDGIKTALNDTWTTLETIPSVTNMYILNCYLNNTGAVFQSSAFIISSSEGSITSPTFGGTTFTFQMSGTSLQAKQMTGGTQNILYTIIKIGRY